MFLIRFNNTKLVKIISKAYIPTICFPYDGIGWVYLKFLGA